MEKENILEEAREYNMIKRGKELHENPKKTILGSRSYNYGDDD
jgi:hypothetical protein